MPLHPLFHLVRLHVTSCVQYVQKQPPEVFFRKGVLKYFANFIEKIAVLESLFNNAAGLTACNFIKKRLQHRCYTVVKLAKFYEHLF